MEDKKVLLSVRDLTVKFRVRGRILTAIRGISLDIYENESIAIVGESGSGKSVFTKTFAGMLDSNGFISEGSIIFNDDELVDTRVTLNDKAKRDIAQMAAELDGAAPLLYGGNVWKEILALESDRKARMTLSDEEDQSYTQKLKELSDTRIDETNRRQTLDPKTDKAEIKASEKKTDELTIQIKALEKEREQAIKKHAEAVKHDRAYNAEYDRKMAALKEKHEKLIHQPLTKEMQDTDLTLAREIYISVGRYTAWKRHVALHKLVNASKEAMRMGVDLSDWRNRKKIFDDYVLYVRFERIEGDTLIGSCIMDLAKVKYPGDWSQVRGKKIATVFQDPMTSLNPITTIGKQISSIIMKHQGCSEADARKKAIEMMKRVGIPNAEKRYDDYPFEYSGGMRQRIVIAIALSCQPKILICDEPTTALDVTIQAQILKLIKDLQKELHYTIVFITHDLGVVANIADRVAVMYAGQIIEIGEANEIFHDPRHPYTWALLSSLPQLAEKGEELYSINGTPPSLYNKVVGDAFAPRNPYCMKIDTVKEAPMFQVSPTHFAKTWLCDPRAPKIEKPEAIRDIHSKLIRSFNIKEM